MRWSNALLQQADVIVAAGTRLGIQQTGFNWEGFAPLAKIVQIDIDEAELGKGHPHVDVPICADATETLLKVLGQAGELRVAEETVQRLEEWRAFGAELRSALPLQDPANAHASGFLDPFEFMTMLSAQLAEDDVVIPCSSGGAFTVSMQALEQKQGQRIATDKGLASMGYGLSGAIGAALTNRAKRVILIEGDGGFAQNVQEVGTAVAQGLPVKMFIFCNEGYASIRMTQRNYFGGAYVGCDIATGLGLPDWVRLFGAYDVPVVSLDPQTPFDNEVMHQMRAPGPAAFLVPIDPEQTYFPKINSRVTESGAMESSPLHAMSPDLSDELSLAVFKYLRMGETVE
jgi:acetolactate synthase-1/2/3 large subunit